MSEPEHIKDILPDVLADILRRVDDKEEANQCKDG